MLVCFVVVLLGGAGRGEICMRRTKNSSGTNKQIGQKEGQGHELVSTIYGMHVWLHA